MWKSLVRCWKIIKQYLCNCSIHGFRYLGDDQFSYFERLFWLVACVLCWWGCANMIISVVQDSLENPVAITPETTFLEWQTPFPAVAFCISSNSAMKKKYFKMKPGIFTNYSNSAATKATAEELLEAFEELKMPCSSLFRSCSYNNQNFNCCEEFHPMPKSGLGYCIAYNSMQTTKPKIDHYVNKSAPHGDLVIDIIGGKELKIMISNLEIYLLSNDGLPLIITDEDLKMRVRSGCNTHILFVLGSIANQPGVENVPIIRRNCRFQNELIDGSFFDSYTFDGCILQVMAEQMIKFCGCVHFYYHHPAHFPTCSMEQVPCIVHHKPDILSSEAVKDRCLSNCNELHINVNQLEPFEIEAKDIARLHFSTLMLPRLRYRRYVVHDLLDIVVSVGGAVGLFTGASILSFFEIPYWLFIRRDKIT